METDLQYYTRLVVEELRAAYRAATPEARRAHERRATAFTLQMHRLENGTFPVSDAATRFRAAALAA